ncbi:RagB/SusD family nutrient uptake outer membrane protein [Sphingobacterium tabacisoli]|uniref:RagB/SusD family nutrient uptake outer membrane protein n=1 Tax=Sphingobacterium tabacisoli TaxID=2044855 RepID=A0ABW5KZ30_9SPHI|nr:RagB/SusD family nutrient uptake outer membrane protein [Sphingobacterium tabacisoli]
MGPNFKNRWKAVLGVFFLLHVGCSRLLDIDLPKNEITDNNVFTDSVNASAAISGVYVAMMQAYSLDFCSGGMTAFPGMSADEIGQTASNSNDEFFVNTISSTNSTVSYLWTSAYRYLYAVHACMEGIANSGTITAEQKASLLAEARFVRAYINFYLVNIFGGVPIVLGTDYKVNSVLPRSSEQEVYDLIKEDLSYCKEVFSKNKKNIKRPGYYATLALLARVYLYEKNYVAAVELTTEVIDKGGFNLESTPERVFEQNSNETIWALMPVIADRATWEGYYFVPARATTVPRYIVTDGLLNSFDLDDKRKLAWIGTSTVRNVKYHFPNKYRQYTPAAQKEWYVMLRLAEQYLIRAESKTHLSNFDEARSDINYIRQRAGIPYFHSVDDKDIVLREIEAQRKLELMCEWGHRWLDLKRTGRADAVLSAIKSKWNSWDVWYPIPQDEITNNPKMEQNLNYR